MTIRDLLNKKGVEVLGINANDNISDAIKIFNKRRVGSLIVKEAGEFVGIITERDIIERLSQSTENINLHIVSSLMTAKHDILTIEIGKDIDEAMHIMTENRIRHLPVVDQGKLVGVISIGDVVKALLFVAKAERKILGDYIATPY